MHHLKVLFSLGIFVCLCHRAEAANIRLVSGRSTNLSGIGIRIRPFKEQRASQMPDPSAVVYTNSVTKEKKEAFHYRDLWRRDQIDAFFAGKEGKIWIAEPKYLLPEGLELWNKKHVQLDKYQAAIVREAEWTPEKIQAWVGTFGKSVVESGEIAETGAVSGLRLKLPYERYVFDGTSKDHVQGFLLHPKEGPLVFVLFSIDKRVRASKAASGIESVMKSLSTVERKENLASNKRLQNRKMKVGGERSKEFEATRKRVIQSVKAMNSWWYVETPNYILKSDLDSKNRRLVQGIQEDLEILRSAYETFISPVREIKEVSVVTIFANRKDYQAYVPSSIQWSGGLWSSARRELIISPSDKDRKKKDEDSILPIVYHEGFHQYIHYALDEAPIPTWWNEGHAGFFEASKVNRSRKTIEVELHESNFNRVAGVVKSGNLELEQLMMMTQQEFYDRDAEKRSQNYAMAWGLVYFFRNGHTEYKGKGYDRVCDNVMKTCAETRDWRKGSKAGMYDLDMKQLEADFIDFYTSGSKMRRANKVKLFQKK